jgi:hypothetical protein
MSKAKVWLLATICLLVGLCGGFALRQFMPVEWAAIAPPAGSQASTAKPTKIATELDLQALFDGAVGAPKVGEPVSKTRAASAGSPAFDGQMDPNGGLSRKSGATLYKLNDPKQGQAATQAVMAAAEAFIKTRGGDLWHSIKGPVGNEDATLQYVGLGYRLAGRRGYLHLWITHAGNCLSVEGSFYETDGEFEAAIPAH